MAPSGGRALNAGCNSITEDPLPLLELPGDSGQKGAVRWFGGRKGTSIERSVLNELFLSL